MAHRFTLFLVSCVFRSQAVACVALVAAAGCASASFDGDRYLARQVDYRLGAPGAGWERVDADQANVAWHNPGLEAVLMANSHCQGFADAPLETLTNELLMGTTERNYESQEKKQWAKREALETVAVAKLDGVARKYAMFVVKKDGCVYDLVLNAPAEQFEAARGAYDRVRDGFDVAARPDRS